MKISSNNGQPSGLGAIGGGALGAVAGSAIGGGRGSIVTGIIGGIAGAVAGNAVENGVAVHDGLEITVRLDNGDMRAITQSATGEIFQRRRPRSTALQRRRRRASRTKFPISRGRASRAAAATSNACASSGACVFFRLSVLKSFVEASAFAHDQKNPVARNPATGP